MARVAAERDDYVPERVEAKWRLFWEEERTNQVDLDAAERPFFNLMMYPYPSAEGLHVGNLYAFTGADIHGLEAQVLVQSSGASAVFQESLRDLLVELEVRRHLRCS